MPGRPFFTDGAIYYIRNKKDEKKLTVQFSTRTLLKGKSSICQITIRSPGASPDDAPRGYIEYKFHEKMKEVHLSSVIVNLEKEGLANFLVYLLAKDAQFQGYDQIRTLSTAPTALNFYKKIGFEEDPTQDKISISFPNEETGKIEQVHTTMEYLATANDFIKKYEEENRWAFSNPPSPRSVVYENMFSGATSFFSAADNQKESLKDSNKAEKKSGPSSPSGGRPT
jgi:hypothetical protein